MAQLALHLLGSPSISLDDEPVILEQRKALALLAYLALTARPQQRGALAALLWPEHQPVKALANLRQTLWLLRSTGLGGWLALDRHTAALRDGYWLDVAAFETALASGRAEQAVALYRGDLLVDLALPDAPQVAVWLAGERARLRQTLLTALPPLIAQCCADGAFAQAITYARRWAALDPHSEPARRQLAEIALRVTAPPPAAAAAAVDRADRSTPRPSQQRGDPRSNWWLEASAPQPPSEPTSTFVGRARELAELRELLGRPGCRLLTLVGPGGIGKTRLARELAVRLQPDLPDGVVFVPLQGMHQRDQILGAIAAALGLALQGQAISWPQLGEALRPQALLLVLDNGEQLLDGAVPLVTLLAAAPQLRVLVTSREPLRLQEEWLYPLEGLTLPDDDDGERVGDASAVQLFLARIRQVGRDQELCGELGAVARICRLVAGMPLAIELAAAWSATLSCAEIAAEIASDLAFLESDRRDIPERHRSVRVVFDQVWDRLGGVERAALMRLAVFRDGFTRETAAEEQLTLTALMRLVDSALIRRDTASRFQFHELLRQYALQRLEEHPTEAAEALASYGRTMARFLVTQFDRMLAGEQRAAIAAIAAERKNIAHAWPALLAHTRGETLRRAADALANYYFFCGPYDEGLRSLTLALDKLSPEDGSRETRLLRAALLMDLALFRIRLGDLAAAEADIVASAQVYADLDAPPPPGIATDPTFGAGLLALIRGDYTAAARCATAMRARSERHGLLSNLPYAWYLLTEAALAQGLTIAAQRAARQALVAARKAGDEWFSAYLLAQLGQIAITLGHLDEAEQHIQAGYAIREAFGDQQGMALALLNLGTIARCRGADTEAETLYERAQAIYARIGDRGGVAEALDGLGALACARGEGERARRQLADALELATDLTFRHVMLSVLTHIAALRLAVGQPEPAAGLLALVVRHPSARRETSDLAHGLLAQCEIALPPEQFTEAVRASQAANLDSIVEHELARLTLPLTPGGQAAQAPPGGMRRMPERLIEALTDHELAILALIAEGLSNQAIADRLSFALGTIKWYTGQIYGKLGVQTRIQAVARARQLQLLP